VADGQGRHDGAGHVQVRLHWQRDALLHVEGRVARPRRRRVHPYALPPDGQPAARISALTNTGASKYRPLISLSGRTCPQASDATAQFNVANSNTEVAGTCKDGYTMTNGEPPRRVCQADGTWAETTNPCTRTAFRVSARAHAHRTWLTQRATWCAVWTVAGLVCSATVDDATSASFNSTPSGGQVAGDCLPGHGPGAQSPSRKCELTGVWGPVQGSCIRAWAAV